MESERLVTVAFQPGLTEEVLHLRRAEPPPDVSVFVAHPQAYGCSTSSVIATVPPGLTTRTISRSMAAGYAPWRSTMLANAASTEPFSKGNREISPATRPTVGRPRARENLRAIPRATPSIAGAPSMPTSCWTRGAIPVTEPVPVPQLQGGAVGRVQPASTDRAALRRFAHLHHSAERSWEQLLTKRASAAIDIPSFARDHPRRHPIERFLRLSIAPIHPSAWKGAVRFSENPLQAKFAP
jgi:hypothetical protein